MMMQVIRVCDDDGVVGAGVKADLALCVCVHAVFMDALFPSLGECGWCCGWYGDRKCMVPQSLRPPNYLSSSP